MRVIFAGTPEFAAVTLRRLLRCNHAIELVLTQPDSPSGRGRQSIVSPVKQVALEHNIAVQQPITLKDPALAERLAQCRADVFIVAAYGMIVPPEILRLPRFGCLNVHASLLPRWRGAAPIQRAIMAGDKETGACIMQMDAGLDTGPVYLCKRMLISADDTAGSLLGRLAELGAGAVCEVLDQVQRGVKPTPQAIDGITYASKIVRDDARICWDRPAHEIERLMRALDPTPGAFTDYEGKALKLWRATVRAVPSSQAPGTVVSVSPQGLEVRCSDANLLVTELQRAGGRRLPAALFLRGFDIRPGSRLGA